MVHYEKATKAKATQDLQNLNFDKWLLKTETKLVVQ